MVELFSTDRLMIRKFNPDDYSDLAEILTNVEVTYFEPYEVFTREACIQDILSIKHIKERDMLLKALRE